MSEVKIMKIPGAGLLMAGAGALVVASWYRAYKADTLMVDGHALNGWPGNLVFIAVLSALGIFSLAFYKLWKDDTLEPEQVKVLAFVLAYVFSCMLPVLSNDIFSYMVFGDAMNKGADVYTNAQSTHFSSFYPYITGIWTSSTCAYGPVVLLLAMLSAWIAAGKIWLALAVYKILILAIALLFIEVASRVSMLLQTPVRNFTFIVLNPVFLLQGVGQLHADLIAITFVMCAIYFLLTLKWQLAFVMVALSVATKMNYVLMLPFFAVGLALQTTVSKIALYRNMATGTVLAVLTLVAFYFPFYTSLATITTPFTFHYFQNPSKGIGEILSYGIYFAPKIFSGHNSELHDTVNASSGPSQQVFISYVVVRICQVIALFSSAYILWRFAKGERSMQQWLRVYVRALLLFLLYYLHIFNPWYLMMFLPFMWGDEEPAFMHWLFVLTCFISVQDMVCIISRDSVAYVVELVLTFLSVALFMYKPRRMFFASLEKQAG